MNTNTARFPSNNPEETKQFLWKFAGKYTEFTNSYSKTLSSFRVPWELKKIQSYQLSIRSVSDVALPAFEPHDPFQSERYEYFVITDQPEFMTRNFSYQ